MNPVRTIASLKALALAAACSPLGLSDAARLDPLNTPPSALGLAVGVPDAIMLRDGDAVLRIAYAAGGETLVDASVPLSVRRGLAGARVGRRRAPLEPVGTGASRCRTPVRDRVARLAPRRRGPLRDRASRPL